MSQPHRSNGQHHCAHRHNGHAHAPVTVPCRRQEAGLFATLRWGWQWFWFILVRNRFTMAVTSLLWLLVRTGPRPSRLAYPCQQVAVANLGILAVFLVPVSMLGVQSRRFRVFTPRAARWATGTIALGGALYVLLTAGVIATPGGESTGALAPAGLEVAPTTVAIVQDRTGSTVTDADVKYMVRKAVAGAGGLAGVVNPGDSVVIKPNIVQSDWAPGEGVTTDPRVVREVVRLCQEAGAGSITIAEGVASSRYTDGRGYFGRDITWKGFKDAGYDTNSDHIDDVTGVPLYDLNDTGGIGVYDPNKVVQVSIPNGIIRTSYWVPRILVDSDVLISVPMLKNHGNGSVTMSLKNRVGCAPSDLYHAQFSPYAQQLKWSLVHSVSSGFPRNVLDGGPYPVPPPSSTENTIVQYSIVDLNLVRPQDFVVIDGLIGIMDGPVGINGTVIKPNPFRRLIMAGRDSVAIDSIGALAMGYDPTGIAHISWSDNRGLGTFDTRDITVMGDRVASVRMDFPAGYGGAPRADGTPPVLGGINLIEGQPVTGMTVITGSGASDNIGLAKAELRIKPLKPNLVVNGNFETGDATGWTPWRASWGANEARDFANTETGKIGNYCLKLGNNSTVSSFGVYQEIPVQPGKKYKLDAYWKGNKIGNAHWYEILLLDGGWDPVQADTANPATIVEANYMYAFDNNTYGLPASFPWTWTKEQNGTPVDWNSRFGVRQATGSTMTVVLKAGACCGTTGDAVWFDQVSVTEVGDEQVVAATINPGSTFQLNWDTAGTPLGQYQASVVLYDAAMNEDVETRTVEVVPPSTPLIELNTASFTHDITAGDALAADTFTVTNVGVGTLSYSVVPSVPWIIPDPTVGTSTGEADLITVNYNTALLDVGVNTGTITIIDPGAYNSPRIISVSITVDTVKPDLDRDGDVDIDDFGIMQKCLSAMPGSAPPAGCDLARMDSDPDVDQADVALLRLCLSGAGVTADKTCDDGF